jgi:hypothetical protein
MPLIGRSAGSAPGTIMIETDLFEHRKVKSGLINPRCFGEDLAAWLKQQLARFPALGFEISEPIQEDYGWGLWALRGKDPFWIALSHVGDRPQEEPAHWVVFVEYDPGPNLLKRIVHRPDRQALVQLRERIRLVLASSTAVKTIQA